jgi:hypothetical protein
MEPKIRSWLAPPLHQPGHRSIAERFAIPHAFTPNLSPPEVVIRLFAALTRIILGSLLFALWGVASSRVWNAIPSHFWRLTAILPLALLFLIPFAGLMVGISAAVRAMSNQRH